MSLISLSMKHGTSQEEARAQLEKSVQQVRGQFEHSAVGLDERAAVANNNKADLFISLHANAAVSALTSVLEPIMIVVMGVVIGGMVIAMYLPMFDMIQAAQG